MHAYANFCLNITTDSFFVDLSGKEILSSSAFMVQLWLICFMCLLSFMSSVMLWWLNNPKVNMKMTHEAWRFDMVNGCFLKIGENSEVIFWVLLARPWLDLSQLLDCSTWSSKRSEATNLILISRSTSAQPHLSRSTRSSDPVEYSVLNTGCYIIQMYSFWFQSLCKALVYLLYTSCKTTLI